MVEYTGAMCTLEINDIAFALSAFTLDEDRGVVSFPRSGKESDLQLAGKLRISGTLSRIQIDSVLLGYVLNSTTVSGVANDLHAGLSAPGASGESVTDMTDTDSKSGLIKFTALTSAITAVGKAILYGTDINDNKTTEVVTIPKLGINETTTGKKIFKTLTHVALFDYVHANTLKVQSVAGASSITVGRPKYFKIKGKAVNGSNHVYVIADNCFLTKGSFGFTDADGGLSDTLNWTMKDPDADYSVEET